MYFREDRKLWVGRLLLGSKADGSRNRRVVYGETKQEVIDKINQLRG